MLECRDIIHHQIKWHPKIGSSLFWFDNWTRLGILYFLVPPEFGIDESIHNVYDVLEDGDWNINRLMDILPEEYALHIVEKIRPPIMEDVIYVPYWMLEARGHFFVNSAWEYVRMRNEPRVAYKMIWVKGLTFKIAFFMWKVSTALQCLVQTRKPGLKVSHKWQDLLSMMENYTTRLKYQKVIWEQPMESWLKVNTDGASKGNPGRSAIGLCVTDEEGEIIYVVGREIAEGTNTEVEAIAIVESLKNCRLQNYTHIWLEPDSLLLKNIIEGVWKPPWCIVDQVEEIVQLMEGFIFKVTHIYREGNKLADHLANYALEVGTIECHDFWKLDSQSRRLVNEDNM
ncbi:uncharacterized protein [Nicotiana tomentosiformis]|uniref:uncharacterized protein n=1 Tax=Nicotiana tomentosiformis TaxID=4098 RepID=UPI00388CE8AA